ncbi:hypothetical protein [Methanocella sp. MCL-LM]|uniref:hypothetical protein n=1 Tax=Methanocella sp. MCL-LM TaxID=3412035 RepID=UPI003C75DC88
MAGVADVALAGVILLISLYTFVSNDFCAYLSGTLAFIPGNIFSLIGCALISAILLGRILGTGSGNVICLGWALYLPSVLYFSRLDLLSLLIPGGFRVFSSSLPAPVILVAGIGLTLCTLAHGSVAEMTVLRSGFLARGADRGEVETAIRKNMFPVALILMAALGLSATVAVATGLLGPLVARIAAGSSLHLVFLAGGTLLFALLILVRLWSKKAG